MFISILCVLSASGAIGVPSAPMTLAELGAEVLKRHRLLKSVYFESESSGRTLVTPDSRRKRVAAISGSKRFVESAHYAEGFELEDDLERTRSYLTDDSLSAFWVTSRVFETSKSQVHRKVSTKIRHEFFLECTGWWPLEDFDLPNDLIPALALLNVLKDEEHYTVANECEHIRGSECIVVENRGYDKLWLARCYGYSIVRRELTLAGRNRYIVYENADFEEVIDSVWLPRRLCRTVHRGPSAGVEANDGYPAVWAHACRTLTSLSVNSVPDELFHFSPVPGTVIIDIDTGKTTYISGGTELLDEVAVLGRKFVRYQKSRVDWVMVTIGGGVAMACVSLLIAVRTRRTAVSKRSMRKGI